MPCRESVTKRPEVASGDHESSAQVLPTDPGLMFINKVWDRLPQPIKDGIVAMVKAAIG